MSDDPLHDDRTQALYTTLLLHALIARLIAKGVLSDADMERAIDDLILVLERRQDAPEREDHRQLHEGVVSRLRDRLERHSARRRAAGQNPI